MSECMHCGQSCEGLSACHSQICINCCYKCFNLTLNCKYIDAIEKSMIENEIIHWKSVQRLKVRK
jgi:hypothetical protein